MKNIFIFMFIFSLSAMFGCNQRENKATDTFPFESDKGSNLNNDFNRNELKITNLKKQKRENHNRSSDKTKVTMANDSTGLGSLKDSLMGNTGIDLMPKKESCNPAGCDNCADY